MTEPPFHPLVWLMDVVADAVDWMHETFSDPAISRALREDLGVDAEGNLPGQMPDGSTIRMRDARGDPVDVDKAAFEATVQEVRETYRLVRDFLGPLNLSPADLADLVQALSRIGAAESIEARAPLVSAIARAAGFYGSGQDAAALDVVRAVDLLGGPSTAASDTSDPGTLQALRNWVGVGSVVALEVFRERLPLDLRAGFGFEPEPGSSTPVADAAAQGAYSVTVTRRPGTDDSGPTVSLSLTVVHLPGVPATATNPARPYRLLLGVGASGELTEGRRTVRADAPAGANFLLTGPDPWNWTPLAGHAFTASATFGRPAAKALELGETDGPHILVDSIGVSLELSATSSVRLTATGVDFSLALDRADSFISSLSQELRTRFDLALVYDKEGLRFEGGPVRKQDGTGPEAPPGGLLLATAQRAADFGTTTGGLEATVPPRTTQFGPFRILGGRCGIGRGADGSGHAGVELSTSAAVRLGPVRVTIDRIGLVAELRARHPDPNLGLLDFDLRLKEPVGIGVTIDAGLVQGGGFLCLDTAKGEYGGVLELRLGTLTVKAVALLNTRAPEPAGWSLLLLLFAEFRNNPWLFGPGFSITAVGGLIGLQHAASVEQLRGALGTNVFDDVLFPADPVTNAPRLLGRLRQLFPVQAHALVAGPMVEVNWGAPPLVTARLAVLVQVRDALGGGDARFTRLTVLGTITATAPPVSRPAPRLVTITADVLGDYDAESGLLAIDARLRDSALGGVPFSGSLIVRIGLGANPAFAISAGGFHPDFTDLPPALPTRIDRLALVWKVGDKVTLTLQAYAAITASSWQVGALFTLVADLGPVDIDGALGFDAVAYDDGRFAAEIGGHVRVRWRGHTLMAVTIRLVVDRNAAQVWHAAGSASFSVLWWDKEVGFEETWGDERSLPPIAAVDAAARVRVALGDPANWSSRLPGAAESLVTLATDVTGQVVRAHPLGELTVTQRVLPLGLALDHVDGAPVPAGTVVEISAVRVGTGPNSATRPIRQPFPRARFQQLTEHQRLTERTFETFPAGVVVAPPAVTAPTGTVVRFDFERIVLRPDGSSAPGETTPPTGDRRRWHLQAGLAARTPLRAAARLVMGVPPRDLGLRRPPVVLAAAEDLSVVTTLDESVGQSPTLARQRAGASQVVVEAQEIGVPA
jgi:hypothetical protein